MSSELSRSDAGIPPETIHWYVDESGDPTIFAKRRTPIVETEGCSRYFMLGMLEVEDPVGLAAELDGLRGKLVNHPYFKNVPSFNSAKGRTTVAFHAKDDPAEVRFQCRPWTIFCGRCNGSTFNVVTRMADCCQGKAAILTCCGRKRWKSTT
jgi:hypothetical protein